MTDKAVAWLREQILSAHAYAKKHAERRPINPMRSHEMRDLIAACEAHLAILDEHPHGGEHPMGSGCYTCQYSDEYGFGCEDGRCKTVRAVASAYRHRDGYAEHWGNG